MGKPTDKPRGIVAALRYFDRDYWQMREALGYPMPYWVQRRWPRQFQDGGTNPHTCGSCEARKRYPDLHLKHDAERQGGMYVAPKTFQST